MWQRAALAALALTLLAGTQPASAGVLSDAQAERMDLASHAFTCPLGGERFRQIVGYPHFSLETFPDGSHMGDQWVDMQIPQCPDNGLLILPDMAATQARDDSGERREDEPLLVYHSYSADELARLPALLADPEWQAMQGQTRSYRAWWLATQLGRPPRDRIELLQWAAWGTETPEQRQTALEAIVTHMPRLIDALGMAAEERGFARYYVINAYRQLGRFDEALALLGTVEDETPGVPTPPDPDAIFAPASYADPMARAIAARDSDRYAIDLLSDDMAGRICGGSDSFAEFHGPNTAARCVAREQAQAVQQAEWDAVSALEDDPEALAASCAATAEDARGATLAEACRRRQHSIDWAGGERFLDDSPVEAAAMCASVAEEARNTMQTSACGGYEIYLGGAVGQLLDGDDAAFGQLCDTGSFLDYGPLSSGCEDSQRRRNQQQARLLWQDQRALRRACRDEAALEQGYTGLNMACDALEWGTDDPYWLKADVEGEYDMSPISLAAMPYARQIITEALAAQSGQVAQ